MNSPIFQIICHRSIGFFFLLGLLTTTLSQAQNDSRQQKQTNAIPSALSLDEALEYALQQNANVRVADAEVIRTDYARKKAWAALFPKVDINGSYNYTLKKQKMFFGGMKFPGMGGNTSETGSSTSEDDAVGIEVGMTHNIQTGIQAGIPIIAPQLWQSLSIKATDVELALEKARSSKIDMTAEVRKAYYQALLANEAYRVYKQSYDNAGANYKQIKEKYEHGLVAQYDLLRTEVQMKNLEPNVMQAEQSIVLAMKQLKLLLGMPAEAPLSLTDSLGTFSTQLYKSYLQTDSLMLQENTTLRQMTLQDKQLRQALTASKWAFSPTLSLGFVYNYNYMGNELKLDNSKRWIPYSMINLTLSIPIFNGGSKIQDIRMQQMARQQLQWNRNYAGEQITLGARRLQDQMENAVKRYAVTKDAIASAEKGYEIAALRYKMGESTLIELNDADLALLQARLNYNQSIFDFLNAKTEWDKLAGYLPAGANAADKQNDNRKK